MSSTEPPAPHPGSAHRARQTGTPPGRRDEPAVLVVATHRAWVARDLAAATTPVTVIGDHALDAPDAHTIAACEVATGHPPAWWTPVEHAARLRAAGVPFPAQAPGPHLLPGLATEFLQRRIDVTTVADLPDLLAAPEFSAGAFVKLAEAKHPTFLAQWHPTPAAAVAAAATLPATSVLHVTATRLDLATEWRVFIRDRTPLAGTCYLTGGRTYDPDDPAFTVPVPDQVLTYAARVAASVQTQPDGWVLDVAATRPPHRPPPGTPAHGTDNDGDTVQDVSPDDNLGDNLGDNLVVVEANPAWSSNPYGAAPEAVVATIIAAFRTPRPTTPRAQGGPAAAQHAYLWRPDPVVTAYASSRALLRRSRPTWADQIPS